MKTLGLLMVTALMLTGCYLNVEKTIKAMEASERAKCGVVSTPMYGTLTIAVGSAGTNVSASASGCMIEGADFTTVRVPIGQIQVTPPKETKW